MDDQFLTKVAKGNMAEIEIGKFVETRASNPQVREFAAELVKDHQQNQQQVTTLLKNHKVGTIAGTEEHVKDEINRLSKLQGVEFDREFLNMMIKDHRKDIAEFEMQAKNGKVADINTFAQQSLPVLQKHLQKAENLAKMLNK